jgi:hypothetical protein
MKRLWFGVLPLSALVLWGALAASQPPGDRDRDRDRPPDRKDGPPRDRPGGPPRFELGHVLPPFAREQLNLTRDQEKEIAELEKMVKERLTKILTAEQQKKLENLRPPRPDGPPREGPPREAPRRPGADDRPRPPADRNE